MKFLAALATLLLLTPEAEGTKIKAQLEAKGCPYAQRGRRRRMTYGRCVAIRTKYFDQHYDLNKDGKVTLKEYVDRVLKSPIGKYMPKDYEQRMKQHWGRYCKYFQGQAQLDSSSDAYEGTYGDSYGAKYFGELPLSFGQTDEENFAEVDVGAEDRTPCNKKTVPELKIDVKTPADYNKRALAIHNCLRKYHGVEPLTLDAGAVAKAQAYAEKLDNANQFAHSSRSERNNCGENLAWHSDPNTQLKTDSASENWYLEVKDYDFNNKGKPRNFHKVGHFTQLVWKKTTKLGCGVAGKVVVCHYCDSAGNFGSDYGSNVFPFKAGKKETPVVAPADDPPAPAEEITDEPEKPDAPADPYSPKDGEKFITRKGFTEGFCGKRYKK